jgi:hypothetical protein
MAGMSRTNARVLVGSTVVLIVVVGAALMWRGAVRDCTLAGCGDQVTYSIPDEAYVAWGAGVGAPVTVETCIDDECRTGEVTLNRNGATRGSGGEVFLDQGTLDFDLEYNVTLKVTDPTGMVRYARTDSGVTLEEFQPNGPNCPPTCAGWLLALEPEDLGL